MNLEMGFEEKATRKREWRPPEVWQASTASNNRRERARAFVIYSEAMLAQTVDSGQWIACSKTSLLDCSLSTAHCPLLLHTAHILLFPASAFYYEILHDRNASTAAQANDRRGRAFR